MIYSTGQLIQNVIKKIEDNKEKKLTGIPSGFTDLDQLTSGWQASDLIIIGARPDMGKTAFALSMLGNMAIEYGIPVAIFSLELSSEQLMNRMISTKTGISGTKLEKEKLKDEELKSLVKLSNLLLDAPIYIEDSPSVSISDLEKRVLDLVIHHKVKIIIIDYLQLMTLDDSFDKFKNREEELSIISRRLKVLARELNIPIIVLSQVSREVDGRKNRRPELSDLLASSDLEVNADIVSFIYRPEYYGILEWDDDKHERADGEAEFIIVKNLRGPIGNIRLRFISRIGLFRNRYENDRDWGPPIKNS